MRLTLKTYVEQPLEKVFDGFNQELFLKLKPPGIGLKLLRFDGCETGDIVDLQLNFGLFRQRWKCTVTDSAKTESEIYFVDESGSKELPFFLKSWKHCHRLIRQGIGTLIVDEITYRSPFGMNLLMYPVLWMQFAWRRPIYRKIFKLQKEAIRE